MIARILLAGFAGIFLALVAIAALAVIGNHNSSADAPHEADIAGSVPRDTDPASLFA